MAEMESDQRNIWGGFFLFKNAYLGDHEYVDICVVVDEKGGTYEQDDSESSSFSKQ